MFFFSFILFCGVSKVGGLQCFVGRLGGGGGNDGEGGVVKGNHINLLVLFSVFVCLFVLDFSHVFDGRMVKD